jgi:hypothetical protein
MVFQSRAEWYNGEERISMPCQLRRIAAVLGILIVALANAAEPAAAGSEIGANSVTMRSWPMAGSWSTALGSNPVTGRFCATYAADGQTIFGLRTESDPYKSLSLDFKFTMHYVLIRR